MQAAMLRYLPSALSFLAEPSKNPKMFVACISAAIGLAVYGVVKLRTSLGLDAGEAHHAALPGRAQGPEGSFVAMLELVADYAATNPASPTDHKSSGIRYGSGVKVPAPPPPRRGCIPRFMYSREIARSFLADAESSDNTSSSSNAQQQKIIDTIGPANANVVGQVLVRLATEYDELHKRRMTDFDDDNVEHVALLERLWRVGIARQVPNQDDDTQSAGGGARAASSSSSSSLSTTTTGNNNNDDQQQQLPFERRSRRWEDLGFQGVSPDTDLRGGGMLALDVFLDFVESEPHLVHHMQDHVAEQHRTGTLNWLLIACASVNVTVSLMLEHPSQLEWPRQLLYTLYRGAVVLEEGRNDGGSGGRLNLNNNNNDNNNVNSLYVFKRNEEWTLFRAFCRLHHAAMRLLFTEWIEKNASVMEFEPFMGQHVFGRLFSKSGEVVVL